MDARGGGVVDKDVEAAENPEGLGTDLWKSWSSRMVIVGSTLRS
jgi:hypothetical protein